MTGYCFTESLRIVLFAGYYEGDQIKQQDLSDKWHVWYGAVEVHTGVWYGAVEVHTGVWYGAVEVHTGVWYGAVEVHTGV